MIPFFSRRIGLSASGTPQRIDFGTKVTGQAGAQDVGILHVRTGRGRGLHQRGLHGRARQAARSGAVVRRRDLYPARSAARRQRGPPHQRPRHVAVHVQFQGLTESRGGSLVPARDEAGRIQRQLGIRHDDRLSERSVGGPLRRHRDSGALRPVDRLCPPTEFPQVLAGRWISAAAGEQPLRPAIRVRGQCRSF